MKTKLKEKHFSQLYDTIIEKKRLVLDVEDYYAGHDTISVFLNGSTGEMSENLDDVKTERDFKLIPFDRNSLYRESLGYSVQYSEENKCLFFHLLSRAPISSFTSGAKYRWEEITRFAIDKGLNIYTKKNGYTNTERSRWANGNLEKARKTFLSECDNEEYFQERACGKSSLPVNEQHWSQFNNYVNAKNGSNVGFIEEASKVLPAIFNVKGNEYESLDSYLKLMQFLEICRNGITCLKKSGAKQDLVDKLISYELPDVQKPEIDITNDIYKFAIIQKVPNPEEDMCVIRTFNYTQNVLFEGGRIYVSKKDVLFCKVNNAGDYVHQPLLSKVNHWDFEIEKFPETETVGTKLEYFGKIVQNIEPDNRAIAIWMFLKEPFLETLCKISSDDFANTFVDALRDTQDVDTVYSKGLGVTNRNSKKAFQVLGISSGQFNIMKESFPYLLCRSYYSYDSNREVPTFGALPVIKKLLVDNYHGDISAIDTNTFSDYYDFVSNIFSLYDCYKNRESVINGCVNEIIESVVKTKRVFPNFDIRHNFKMFEEIIGNIVKSNRTVSYYNIYGQIRLYNDFINMSTQIEEKVKPRFESYEDLRTMHDNIMILIEMKENAALVDKFKERKPVWEKWEFQQDEKRNKKGEITQEDIKFVVVSPNVPYDLAKEGTELHHCVKSYIDRVAEGRTNILFIRKKDDKETPFFTVEITNEAKIQQVHGMQNRNACTEEGLEEFIAYWAKKCKLQTGGYNIIR